VHLARFQNDRLVQRLTAMPIAFTNKNPEQNGVFGNLHRLFLFWQKRKSENTPEPYGYEATSERQHCVEQRFHPISITSEIERL
jgi:hypothetical protein